MENKLLYVKERDRLFLTYCLVMEFGVDAMLFSNLGNEKFDAGILMFTRAASSPLLS